MDRAPAELSQALDGTGYAPVGEELAHARAVVSELAELRRSHELLVSALDAASDAARNRDNPAAVALIDLMRADARPAAAMPEPP